MSFTTPVKAGAVVLAAAFVLQLAFAVSYVGALHRPTPHAVPVAVVGPGAESLNHLPGAPLAAHTVASYAAGVKEVEARTVYAIVEPARNRLEVASAAN